MYLQGTNATTLATQMGVHIDTMMRALRRAGVPTRRGTRRKIHSPQLIAKMKKLYASGKTCEQIGAQIGFEQSYVNKLLKDHGVEMRAAGFQRGEAHHGWAGGRRPDDHGYMRVRVYEDDPFYCMAKGEYVLEHRLVMARQLGRPLTAQETVHHIDGDKLNNDPSNLQLRQGKHGKGVVMRCADCGSHNLEHAPLH